MRSAPSVSHPVGRSRFGTGVLAAAWLAGLAAGLAWLVPAADTGWRAVLWAAVLAGCALAGARAALRMPTGLLAWDGTAWHWCEGGGDERAVALSVTLDLQRVLLVRCRPSDAAGGRPFWLWLEAGGDAGHWRALRRAVYSRAPRESQPQDGRAHP
jgi:hypothetical protein